MLRLQIRVLPLQRLHLLLVVQQLPTPQVLQLLDLVELGWTQSPLLFNRLQLLIVLVFDGLDLTLVLVLDALQVSKMLFSKLF